MNPSVNPYTPWPGVPPVYLAGRDGEVKFIEGAFGQAEDGRIGMHPIFVGDTGMGKTTMLNYATQLAHKRDWMVLSVEARSGYSVVDDLLDQVRTLVQDLAKEESPALTRIKSLLSRIQSVQLSVVGSGGGLAMVQPQKVLPVTQLFKELGGLAIERKTKVVFSVDEMDQLSTTEMQLVLGVLHVANQTQMPLIIAGAGGLGLRDAMAKAKGYGSSIMLTKLFPLNYSEMAQAVERPAAPLGVKIDSQALEQLTGAARGNPMTLQLLAFHAWNFALDKTIDVPAVTKAQLEVKMSTLQFSDPATLDPSVALEYTGIDQGIG